MNRRTFLFTGVAAGAARSGRDRVSSGILLTMSKRLLGLAVSAMIGHAWGQVCQAPSHVDVLTHRYNNYRTGANLQETCLTWDNVNTIQRLFKLPVQGQVYAQPLVKTNFQVFNQVTRAKETHNVVFLATMENWIYAYDADGLNRDASGTPQPYWSKPLGLPLPVDRIPRDAGAALLQQYNISPWIGITSTPAIDADSGTMFLVEKRADPAPEECKAAPASPDCPVENRIFAIKMEDGSVTDSQPIQLPPPEDKQAGNPKACKDYPDNDPKRAPTPEDAGRINLQRPALLLTRSGPVLHIYLGFGSHQDAPCPMYHGMMVRFDYDTSQRQPKLSQYPNTFLVTKRGELDPPILFVFRHEDQLGKGGIWQAGNGPAADATGNVYVMTGNGTYKKGEEFGSHLLKLTPNLDKIPAGWFAPPDVKLLDTDTLDVDFGASGPVLVPGTNQVVGGGKQGKIYVVDRTRTGDMSPAVQEFWGARGWSVSVTKITIGALRLWVPLSIIPPLFATGYHHIHGAPVYWGDPNEVSPQDVEKRSLYVWPERDHLRSYGYRREPGKDGAFTTKPLVTGPTDAKIGMPGGFLSISANGIQNGILWAALPLNQDAWVSIVRGELRAFRINADGTKLEPAWTSYCADPSDDFKFAKYVPPVVANGYVYLATFSSYVAVYGVPPGGGKPAGNPGCRTPAPARH